MNNLIELGLQVFLGVLSAVVWFYSLKYLNNCSSATRFIKRMSYILYFTGSTGTLIILLSGNTVDWSYGLFVVASAFHLVSEKRKYPVDPDTYHILHHGKH